MHGVPLQSRSWGERRCPYAALGVLLLGLASCGGAGPARFDWVPPDFTFNPDLTLVCGSPAEPGCAEPTPFDALVDEAFDPPRGKRVHFVDLLDIGDEALLVRIHLVRSARKSIYIQQFIWKQDVSGKLIFDELVKAARRGVEVKILGDQLFTLSDADAMADAVLAHNNLKIKLYNPVFGKVETSRAGILVGALTRFSGVNQRMHNKLMVVDGRIGILGGRNHEDGYFDRHLDYNYNDRDILVIGLEVEDMALSFFEYWNSAYSVPAEYLTDVRAALDDPDRGGFQLTDPPPPSVRDIDRRASDAALMRALFVEPALRVEGRVEFFADGPGKPYEGPKREPTRPIRGTYWAIATILEEVRSQLVVQTPYLLISENAANALRERRREHPDLELIASTNSLASIDHVFVYAVMAKERKRLLQRVGFRIFAFKPVPGDVRDFNPRYDRLTQEAGGEHRGSPERMPVVTEGSVTGLHGKSMVVDERIAFVGSHNFDPRSSLFNTELGILVWDERAARALKAVILRHTAPQNSWVVAGKKKIPVFSDLAGVPETISRMLPVGDVWPFRYAAYFELRAGEEPVPPGHKEFFKRYENVGNFPEVDDTATAIQTRLLGAMTGWARPLM